MVPSLSQQFCEFPVYVKEPDKKDFGLFTDVWCRRGRRGCSSFFFLRFLFIRVNIPFSILMISWCLLGTLNEGILSDIGLKSNASRVKSMTLFGLCLLLFKSNSILTTLKFCRNELSNILFEDWLNDACFTAVRLEKLTAESRLFLKIVFPSLYYLHGLIKNSCILIQTFGIQKIYQNLIGDTIANSYFD